MWLLLYREFKGESHWPQLCRLGRVLTAVFHSSQFYASVSATTSGGRCCLSTCPILVNPISQERLLGISSLIPPGWTDLNLVVKGQACCDRFLPCEHDISGTTPGIPVKFGTNVHLDSNMKWSEFAGSITKHVFALLNMISVILYVWSYAPRRLMKFWFCHEKSMHSSKPLLW